MSYYERPHRPNNEEMWRRKFPVMVLAKSEGEALQQAVKIAKGHYDQEKYSVAVLSGENRGLVRG